LRYSCGHVSTKKNVRGIKDAAASTPPQLRSSRYIRYRDNIGYPRYGERYDIGDNQYSSNNLSYCPINRFLESVPTLNSTPASVLGFAAAVGPRRSSTVSGSHTAGPGCCKCPFHCKLPDGTFRVVRARETDAAANVGTVATVPTSSESRHALQVYHAAVDDLETSAADIAFLRSIFETERQADFDRANPPMPPLLALLTSIFRTRTDPHIFNVFRNAQITLRILIICESYPFLLCLCFCSTYVLTIHILFTLTSFWF
jgi:hypothetical protein